jgi:aminopeptidase
LNGRQYTGLKYTGPGTDLTVGLPRGHRWLAAREESQTGIAFTANLPTEEIFTLPHRERTEGTVRATMPLAYAGSLIEDLRLSFESGRVVRASAKRGEAALRGLIETDEGASRLGEVALVSQSSPIARLKTLFYDTLLDENASSHLAIGRAYNICIDGGSRLSPEEFGQRGGNSSLVHVDFMIGSNKMDIDGLREDGHHEPVMRTGEWAFDL